MNNQTLKKWGTRSALALGGILILMALTNPSMQRFKEFLVINVPIDLEKDFNRLGRSSDWLIFSFYEYQHINDYYNVQSDTYIGILNNFFLVSE